jgi:WD40 repeat protein
MGQKSYSLRGNQKEIKSIAFFADNKHIATAGADSVRIWDLISRAESSRLEQQGATFTSVCVSDDQRNLAAIQWARGVTLWNLKSGQSRAFPDFTAVAFSPNRKSMCVKDTSGPLTLYETASNQVIREFESARSRIAHLTFSPAGKRLAAACNGVVRLWDAATGKHLLTSPSHEGAAVAIRFAAESACVLTASNTEMHLWDKMSGKHLGRFDRATRGICDVSSDGKLLAGVRLPDVFTLKSDNGELFRVRTREEPFSLRFSPDGKRLGVLYWKGIMREWDARKKMFVEELVAADEHYVVLAYSADGAFLACGTVKGTVHLWDLRKRRRVQMLDFQYSEELKAHVSPRKQWLELSTDAKRIAYGLRGAGVVVWDAPSRKILLRRMGHDAVLALSADGKILATGGENGTIHLWEIATGGEICSLEGQEGPIRQLAFEPHGTRLGSVSDDGTALLWNLLGLPKATSFAEQGASLSRAWRNLGNKDSALGYAAFSTLVASQEKAVRLLCRELKPEAVIEAARVSKLLADLGDSDFAVRENAHRALAGIRARAEPALRELLMKNASFEQRRRAQLLLSEFERNPWPPALLRQFRAIQVLEWIASPDARPLLSQLATGDPMSLQTKEARYALHRLDASTALGE